MCLYTSVSVCVVAADVVFVVVGSFVEVVFEINRTFRFPIQIFF